MRTLRRWMMRLGGWLHKRRQDRELDAEIESHIQLHTEDNLRAGMTPEEARRQALIKLGGAESTKEAYRDQRGLPRLETLWQDIRFAVRQLRKNPGFTAVAVATLALGIGACTAMFSLVNAVLLRPLPFHEPARLMWVQSNHPGATLSERTVRVDNFLNWRAQAKSFEALGAYSPFFELRRYSLTGAGESRRLRGVQVSRNFLEVLGIRPLLGRGFMDEECAWNGRRAVILSHAFWQQQFGGAEDVVGRSVTVNGNPVEIVGVLPASANLDALFSPGSSMELLLPLPLTPETFRTGSVLFGIGRLRPGATATQAHEELAVINARLRELHPERVRENGRFGARVIPLEDHIRGAFRPAFLTLSGAVLCVLLIACVNLSNLLLARAHARRHEFSVRVALGASRWRLVRQTITESLLLAFAGGVLGSAGAFAGAAALARLQAFSVPLLHTTSVDAATLRVTFALTALAGCLCGVLPALQLWRRQARESLNATGTRSGASHGASRVRQSLVVAEIALACVLLVGAGLLLRSFVAVLQTDLGFQPAHTCAWRVDTTRRFESYTGRVLYYDRLVERVSVIPGLESVGLSDALPLGYRRAWAVRAAGAAYEDGRAPEAFVRIVDRGGMQTLRIPLRVGRYFDDRDTGNSQRVMLVNETMARKMWPGRDPLGQTLLVSGNQNPEHTVVGIVADVSHRFEEAPQPEMYLNFRQSNDWQTPQLVIRSRRDPSSLVLDIRAALREFDPTLASNEFTTLEQIVDRAIAPRRLVTGILGSFSTLALALAAVGLYGVIACSVNQRTREIGIRLAVGAQRRDVLGLVIGEGLRLASIGVATGLVAALATAQLLRSLLSGISATDPATFVVIPALLLGVTFLACWLPARRAARVDPMVVLRSE